MALDRSCPNCAAVGGVLLAVVSVVWLAKSVNLIVGNAQCCLWAAEGDGRRGIFLATVVSGVQLVTVAVAVAVVRGRARRVALVATMLYGAITVLLLSEGATGDTQLWLNLTALVVSGLAIFADGPPLLRRHRA